MIILAFDTSSPILTAAVSDDYEILGEVTTWLPRGHMSQLIPIMDDMLKKAELQINDVETIVIGSGPGSYTGLRIGMVIARTLAQLLEVPIVGVASADSIAQQNRLMGPTICPIIDAKRGEVYTALYCPKGENVDRLSEFKAISPKELAKYLAIEEFDSTVLAGDAVELYADVFKAEIGERAVIAPKDSWWPKASELISLALPRLGKKDYDELYKLTPIYVRLSQAEEMWEKRHQR